MHAARAHLRRGVGARLLQHLIGEARRRGYRRLSLETGSGPAFHAAHAFYRRFGFEYCGPSGEHRYDAFSRVTTRAPGGGSP